MLKGRLGLETARVPHADRHGCLWLRRGNLVVEDGTLRFRTAGSDAFAAGDYGIPFQMVSVIFLEPGSTVSHDALRLLARHGTGLVATGEEGVRFYASMPFGQDKNQETQVVCHHQGSYKPRKLAQYEQRAADRLGDHRQDRFVLDFAAQHARSAERG